MEFSTYELVYLITNTFQAYNIYRLMHVFYEREDTSRKIECLFYIAYGILMALIYLNIRIPVVMMISNMLAYMALSYNYKASFKKRLLTTAIIYIIVLCAETMVILFTGYFDFKFLSKSDYSSVYGLVINLIFVYILVSVLDNFKHIRSGEKISYINWLSIFLVPVSSLYIILILISADGLSRIMVIMGIFAMMLINFLTVHLYDVLSVVFTERLNQSVMDQQNRYYKEQIKIMESSIEKNSVIRHDLRNHLATINGLIEKRELEAVKKHLDKLTDVCESNKQYIYTRNIDIDSILNFKIQEAQQKNIKTVLDLTVPEKLSIPSFDMAVILGNLFDNAIEAVSKLEHNREISVKMSCDKGRLILMMKNPYYWDLIVKGERYLTTKKEKAEHGFGLQIVKSVLKKYDGSLEIIAEKNTFSVTLLMYI